MRSRTLMSHSIPWESHRGDLKKAIFLFFTQKKIFLIFISRAPKSKNGLFLEVEKLPAWVFAFLASKGFLTSVGKHVIFQSAWPPAREAALIAGKGLLSPEQVSMCFLRICSLVEEYLHRLQLGNNLKNRRKCVHHLGLKARRKGLKKVSSSLTLQTYQTCIQPALKVFKWMSMMFLASILKTETLVMENYCILI